MWTNTWTSEGYRDFPEFFRTFKVSCVPCWGIAFRNVFKAFFAYMNEGEKTPNLTKKGLTCTRIRIISNPSQAYQISCDYFRLDPVGHRQENESETDFQKVTSGREILSDSNWILQRMWDYVLFFISKWRNLSWRYNNKSIIVKISVLNLDYILW